MYVSANLAVTDTRFLSNTAEGNGGGLHERGLIAGSASTVTEAQFINNRATDGGGVWTRNTGSGKP
ncbi:MAG TPA: hypothetical protein VFF59_03875 [Anaerolineae bacterium]|nr:hypothetical protein [Anaerolineae bacterium]